MPTTHYYIDEFTDETLPCGTTLESWAEWLSKPDPDWFNRAEAATEGQEFMASSITQLAVIEVERRDGAWVPLQPIPDGTHQYVQAYAGGGWDVETWADDLDTCLDGCENEPGPHDVACTRNDAPFRVRYSVVDGHPRLDVIGVLI